MFYQKVSDEEAPKDKIYEAESKVVKELAEKGFGLFEVDFPAYLSPHGIVYQAPDYVGFNRSLLGNSDLGGIAYVCILSPKPIAKKAAPQCPAPSSVIISSG